MLLDQSVRSGEWEEKFQKNKQGPDQKEPHRHIKELYPRWHEEAMNVFSQEITWSNLESGGDKKGGVKTRKKQEDPFGGR